MDATAAEVPHAQALLDARRADLIPHQKRTTDKASMIKTPALMSGMTYHA
jgi:hypothetical protein